MQAVVSEPFNREKQFQAKRRAVIASAGQAFRKRGYHNSSMKEIAENLGLTKAALYYYVKNKEEVLFECHLMAYDAMDEILKTPRIVPQSGLDFLATLYGKFVDLLTQSGVSLLTDVDSLSGVWKQAVLARRARIERKITRIVKDGQADGSIRSGEPRLLVFFFMGALNWLNAWYDSEGRLSGEDIAHSFCAQLRAGLSAKAA